MHKVRKYKTLSVQNTCSYNLNKTNRNGVVLGGSNNFGYLHFIWHHDTRREMIFMSENKIANNNIQRHAFLLTINNPLDYGYDHKTIKELLVVKFSTVKYFCMADEIGKEGTYHTHIYVVFTSRVRWSTVKKHFTEAHIDIAKGSAQSNLEYVTKTGKWVDTVKEETKVEGTFEEWGEFPKQKGTNQDMQELYELVKAGYSNADILALNNDYILHLDKIDKLRTMLLIEKFKNTRRLDLKVTYVYGATESGKTRGVLDLHGDANVFRVTDYQHPFDNYGCQEVIVFEEYRSQLRISDMLNYMDIYPIELPARYNNKIACYNHVYIVTNIALENQYREVQYDNPETWNAFLRRIHEVKVYQADGKTDIYNSVKEYMNRQEDFRPMTEADIKDLPFNEVCYE